MKKFLVMAIFLFISIVNASPEIYFQNQNTQPQETILATINTTGEFFEKISNEQIKFYEGRREVFFESDIAYLNNTHYLFIYSNRAGNFSVKISNIKYKENGPILSSNIERDFSANLEEKIEENNSITKVLSIKPGILFKNQDKITLSNKGNSNVSVEFGKNKTNILPDGTLFIYPERSQEFYLFKISSYKNFIIPIFSDVENITPNPIKEPDLKASPKFPVLNIYENEESKEVIQLYNFADENLTILSINSSSEIIIPETISSIEGKGAINYTITLKPKYSSYLEGQIFISYSNGQENNTLVITLAIYILPRGTNESNFEIVEETCQSLNGSICKAGQEVCEGDTKFTKGSEYCCLGTCKALDNGTNGSNKGGSGWIWGTIILVVLGIVGFMIYRRSKKAIQKTPNEQLKQTQLAYEKRMSGGLARS